MSEDISTISAGQVDAVDRDLDIAEHGDGTATLVSRISQVYATTVEDLWDACTRAERLPRWFAPVSGDLELGGRYQVEGNAGGTIERCEPPSVFKATWEFQGNVSWIEVRVEPEGKGARLTLEHTATAEFPSDFWTTYGPGATGVGWDRSFLGLAFHLATGTDKPAEGSGWEQTPSAREFIGASSRRWADLSVAAGTDDAAARAAERQTTAFFTGQEVE